MLLERHTVGESEGRAGAAGTAAADSLALDRAPGAAANAVASSGVEGAAAHGAVDCGVDAAPAPSPDAAASVREKAPLIEGEALADLAAQAEAEDAPDTDDGGYFSPARSVPALESWLPNVAGGYDSITATQREELDDLLSRTFNAVLRVEERALQNRLTEGLTMAEIHAIAAIGLHETNTMTEVAGRLAVTQATLTTTMGKLERKGLVRRERSQEDRRCVLVSLTRRGREVCRAHSLFHRYMIKEALTDLTPEEACVLARALSKVKTFFDRQR